MLDTFGTAPPVVYVADHWGLALTYPMHVTTVGMLPGETQWKMGVHAGTVVSMQPTCPVQVILELYCLSDHRFWHRAAGWNSQSAFPAGCFYIAAVYLVGIYPDLIPKSYPFVGMQPLQRDMYQDCKRAQNNRFMCAERPEIEPEAVCRLLKLPGCRPMFPRPLMAEGGFPDGTPEIWSDNVVDKLCRHPGAHFQVHIMTRHAVPWTATGAWQPIEAHDLMQVRMQDNSLRIMPRDEVWRRSGVAYHWHRQTRGVNLRMPDQSTYPLVPTFRLATVELQWRDLIAAEVIPRDELQRLASANHGTFDGVLTITARYNWATRLREVRLKDPHDPTYLAGEGGFPEAGPGAAPSLTGSQIAYGQFSQPHLAKSAQPHRPLSTQYAPAATPVHNAPGSTANLAKRKRKNEEKAAQMEANSGQLSDEHYAAANKDLVMKLRKYAMIGLASTYVSSQPYFPPNGAGPLTYLIPPAGTPYRLEQGWTYANFDGDAQQMTSAASRPAAAAGEGGFPEPVQRQPQVQERRAEPVAAGAVAQPRVPARTVIPMDEVRRRGRSPRRDTRHGRLIVPPPAHTEDWSLFTPSTVAAEFPQLSTRAQPRRPSIRAPRPRRDRDRSKSTRPPRGEGGFAEASSGSRDIRKGMPTRVVWIEEGSTSRASSGSARRGFPDGSASTRTRTRSPAGSQPVPQGPKVEADIATIVYKGDTPAMCDLTHEQHHAELGGPAPQGTTFVTARVKAAKIPNDLEAFLTQFNMEPVTVYVQYASSKKRPAEKVVASARAYARRAAADEDFPNVLTLTRAFFSHSSRMRKEVMPTSADRAMKRKKAWRKPLDFPHAPDDLWAAYGNHVPEEGEPWFYMCSKCYRCFRQNHRDMVLTKELKEMQPEDRGIWGKCCGVYVKVQLGQYGRPVINVENWRAAYARHTVAGGGFSERTRARFQYAIDYNVKDPADDKTWPFALPGSVLQHARFDHEVLQCIEEDVYRRQCIGFDNTLAPKDTPVPPRAPEDEADDEEAVVPAEALEQTEVDHGSRAETTMAETAATTDLVAQARKAVHSHRSRQWLQDDTRDATSASGTVIETTTAAFQSGSSKIRPKAQTHRRSLEAKQVVWQQASVYSAKRFAIHTVYWYPKNPQWVPEFVHAGMELALNCSKDGFEERVSLTQERPDPGEVQVKTSMGMRRKLVWPPPQDVVPEENRLDEPGPNCGTKRPWAMITDKALLEELFSASDKAYAEAKQKEALEPDKDRSRPWEGPPQKIPRNDQLREWCITEAPFKVLHDFRHHDAAGQLHVWVFRQHPNSAAGPEFQPQRCGLPTLSIDQRRLSELPRLVPQPIGEEGFLEADGPQDWEKVFYAYQRFA